MSRYEGSHATQCRQAWAGLRARAGAGILLLMLTAAGSSWALIDHSGGPNPMVAAPAPVASSTMDSLDETAHPREAGFPEDATGTTRAPSRTPGTEAITPQVTTAGNATPLPQQTTEATAPFPSQVPPSWPRTTEPSVSSEGPSPTPKSVPHNPEPSPENTPETRRPDPPETDPPAPQKPAPQKPAPKKPRPPAACQGLFGPLLGCPQLPLDADQVLP